MSNLPFSALTDYFQYNTNGILYLAAGFISLAVGGLVLIKQPQSKPHQSFFLITFTGAIWLVTFAMEMLTRKMENAYIWLALDYALAAPYISPSVYLFSLEWTHRRAPKGLVKAGYVVAACFSLIIFLFLKDIFEFRERVWGRFDYFKPTPFGLTYYSLFLGFFFFYAALAFWNFYRAWREADSPIRKTQARSFLIAFLIGYAASNDLFIARGMDAYPTGHICFTLFILVVAYMIVRQKFLDIDVFLKRFSLIVLIYAILIALLLPVSLPVLHKLLNGSTQAPILPLFGLSLVLGCVLSLGPVIYAYLIRNSFWLRGQMSTGLTHELKSPLGAIRSSIDILKESLRKPDDQKKSGEYIEIIERNAERLDNFVRDLLNIALLQEGGQSVHQTPLDLAEIIRKEVEFYSPSAQQKGLLIETELDSTVKILGEEERIRQIISNCLSNALKYSSQGKIHVSLSRRNGDAICSVTDEGCGISKQELPHVFDRFFHGKHSNKGAGLGLAIAKGWVEAHGGKIWAESDGEGKGTKVTFTVPVSI